MYRNGNKNQARPLQRPFEKQFHELPRPSSLYTYMPLDSEINAWCRGLGSSGSWRGLFSIYCSGKKFDPIHFCVGVAPFNSMLNGINWKSLQEGQSLQIDIDYRKFSISFFGWCGNCAVVKIPEYDRELIDLPPGHLFHLVRDSRGELVEKFELRQLPQHIFPKLQSSLAY